MQPLWDLRYKEGKEKTRSAIDLKQIESEIWAAWRVFPMDISDAHCQRIYARGLNEVISLKIRRRRMILAMEWKQRPETDCIPQTTSIKRAPD